MYYGDKRESKVNIAEALSHKGWTIYGFHPDTSDSMTDYYNPASWDGIATKNGYTLCIGIDDYDVKRYSGKETYEYTKNPIYLSFRDADRIRKLEAMANDEAAQAGGEFGQAGTAKKLIQNIMAKAEKNREEAENTKVLKEKYPTFQENPGRCNWHIEKDGAIIAKGIGAFSFHALPWEYDCRTMEWEKPYNEQYLSDEEKQKIIKRRAQYAEDIAKFTRFIEKVEAVASVKIGDGEDDRPLVRTVVTKWQKENEVRPLAEQSVNILPGMCFQLKSSFSHGCGKGYTYKIKEINGPVVSANRLDKKYEKVLEGRANRSNRFNCTLDMLKSWIEKGAIELVDIVEVEKPYEVEKWVRDTSTPIRNSQCTHSEFQGQYDFIIVEDIHTKTNEQIFVVKIKDRLSKEEFKALDRQMGLLGGYYSKYKHGFIFQNDPTELLQDFKPDDKPQKKALDEEYKLKLLSKVQQGIDSLDKKIASLSGDYKTNTRKRMREAEGRQQKIESWEIDKKMLQHIKSKLEGNIATTLEIAMMTGAFRDEIHRQYIRKYSKHSNGLKFPEIDPSVDHDGLYNSEITKSIAKLNKAGIYTTADLELAVEEYKAIYDDCRYLDPSKVKEREIKKLESQYKLQQKGDIQFTPPDIAEMVVELADLTSDSVVLEPSAGIGNLADVIRKETANIDCCEWVYSYGDLLKMKGYNVVSNDFLSYDRKGRYDRIIMNPPFSKNQDIKHIKHAYDLVKDGGKIVAICSKHWSFANDKESMDFRDWLESITYEVYEQYKASFEMTGTPTQIIVIDKDEPDTKPSIFILIEDIEWEDGLLLTALI